MRVRVKPGARDMVEEWMSFLDQNMAAVEETLGPERMFAETIFAETLDGVDYLYWYALKGVGGRQVKASEHWLDREHLRFWDACIDRDHPPVFLTPRVLMLPPHVREAMLAPGGTEDAVGA